MRRLLLADGVLSVGRTAAGSQMLDAVLLDGEIITGVGDRERFLVEAPDAVVERLPSGVLLPAFIDPHHHFLLGALSIASPPLPSRPGQPVADLLAAIAARVSLMGSGWVRLHSYDPRLLAERRPPTRAELDAICPERPLVLISFSWHEAVLNSAGLAAMGWSETVRDTPTGRWVRDRRGRLTGEVRETPAYLAEAASRTPLTTELRERWLAGAEQHGQNLLASGIVRVADAAVPPEFDELYLDAVRANALPVTVHRMGVAETALCHPRELRLGSPAGPAASPAGPLKLIVDGGEECSVCVSTWQLVSAAARAVRLAARDRNLEAVRAGLLIGRPRRGQGGWQRGVNFWDPATLRQHVRQAAVLGQPLAFHAIGNQALADVLDAVEAVEGGLNGLPLPSRVEHAMFLTPRLLQRLAASGLHAVVQPPFIDSQGAELGALPLPRDLSLMPFRAMLDSAVPLAFSSDYPVASFDPLVGIRAAVTRQAADGPALEPDQAVTGDEALHAYTLGAAAALGVDQITGSVEVGKQADLILVTTDPRTIEGPPPRVLRTWKAGREVFRT